MKRKYGQSVQLAEKPAAFGRLCVETMQTKGKWSSPIQPPSGGCVLKQAVDLLRNEIEQPAAFGRLCVETQAFAKVFCR